MANSLLTISMITREAVMLFKNSNAFLQNIDHQYDDQYAITGAKIGAALKIRYPNDYTVNDGPILNVQSTQETNTTLTISKQKHVDVSFGSQDRTLSLDDYSERVLAPMINALCGAVAADVMTSVEGGICNMASNLDGTGAVIAPTMQTWLEANAVLDLNSTPSNRRKVCLDPLTEARTVASLAGLLNPSGPIGSQYTSGSVSPGSLGYEQWYRDQTIIKHTTANYSGTKTVNGAGQTGTTITVNAVTGGFKKGDIVTFASVNAVNRVTKVDTGQLRQFVVTADMATGGTSMSIYPAIIPPDGAGNAVQYQTVTASPGNGAAIVVATLAASVHRKNFVYTPQAVTLVTADLWMPTQGVIESAREQYNGVSMRSVSQYLIGSDEAATRIDVLYGYLWIRPEWACVVPDAL